MKNTERTKYQKTKLVKAPGAPRRFKSAFIFYSTWKHKDIRASLENKEIRTTEVAKMVSSAWKSLSPTEREKWDELSRKDKIRYEKEKMLYTGPWRVELSKKTCAPGAPRRPLSAILYFSNKYRSIVRRRHPTMNNADLSAHLVTIWNKLPPGEKKIYLDAEAVVRKRYKEDLKKWKEGLKQNEAFTTSKGTSPSSSIVGKYDGQSTSSSLFPTKVSTPVDTEKAEAVQFSSTSSAAADGDLTNLWGAKYATCTPLLPRDEIFSSSLPPPQPRVSASSLPSSFSVEYQDECHCPNDNFHPVVHLVSGADEQWKMKWIAIDGIRVCADAGTGFLGFSRQEKNNNTYLLYHRELGIPQRFQYHTAMGPHAFQQRVIFKPDKTP